MEIINTRTEINEIGNKIQQRIAMKQSLILRKDEKREKLLTRLTKKKEKI